MSYILIDTETTGIVNPQLIEVTTVVLPPLKELLDVGVENFSALWASLPVSTERFRPLKPIEKGAVDIHGIKFADLINCQPFYTYSLELSDNDCLVGFSTAFDWRVIGSPSCFNLCILQNIKKFVQLEKGTPLKLRNCLDVFIENADEVLEDVYEHLHSSKADSFLTLLLAVELAKACNFKDWNEFHRTTAVYTQGGKNHDKNLLTYKMLDTKIKRIGVHAFNSQEAATLPAYYLYRLYRENFSY